MNVEPFEIFGFVVYSNHYLQLCCRQFETTNRKFIDLDLTDVFSWEKTKDTNKQNTYICSFFLDIYVYT